MAVKECAFAHSFLLHRQQKGYSMSRREIREQIFKMLFRVEFHEEEEYKQQLGMFLEETAPVREENLQYIEEKFQNIVSRLAEIDDLINANATGWKTSRMGKVDLTLIRLAVYEIRYEDAIPTGVAINEAVELAKKYGTDDSASFVNGVLAKIA